MREDHLPLVSNHQQEAVFHDDNAPVTWQKLQGLIGGFQKALNWMTTMMEIMAPRPEDNPLPQRRQEEPQSGEVLTIHYLK